MRVGRIRRESFWTVRGVRQRCPLSPLLFNILLADLAKEMGKVKWGSNEAERGKDTLSHADDIVLLAKNEEGMRNMLVRLKDYLEIKNLELNMKMKRKYKL